MLNLKGNIEKNLMIVSMIVLIYSIAGGAFGNDISFSGAKLTFSRPQWIEIFMIVVMCFLQWRHWLVSRDIRMHHRNEVLSGLYLPGKCVRYLKYAFNPGVTFECVDGHDFAVIKYAKGVGRVKVEIVDVFFTFILIKIVGSTDSYGKGELSPLGLTNDAVRGNGTPHILTDRERGVVRIKYNNEGYGLLSVRYNRLIAFLLLNVSYRARWICLSYKEVWFGDALLPAFVTGSALISYFLSKLFN